MSFLPASNRILFIAVLLFFFLPLVAFSQENFLAKRISINLNQVTVETALNRVAAGGGFRLSYDASLTGTPRRVSLHASNVKVSEILKEIVGSDAAPKQIGHHVILTRPTRRKPDEKRKEPFILEGTITNSATGLPVAGATVYAITRKTAVVTGDSGQYRVPLPDGQSVSLGVMRKGFRDTVLFINLTGNSTLYLALTPIEEELTRLESRKAILGTHVPDTLATGIMPVSEVEQIGLVRWLVPENQRYNARNVQVYDRGSAQVSLIPYLGTHGTAGGSFANVFSFNVLAGYSRATNGFELGGLVNINRQRMRGFQLGGLGNFVGEEVTGFQLGGLFNMTLGAVRGFQLAGLVNWLPDTLKGMQVAGVCNVTTGKMRGMELAGLVNLAFHHVNGWQVAGLANVGIYEINKVQISGLANYGRENWGFQLAGLINVAKKENRGFQLAGLVNISGRENRGAQIAGLFNQTRVLNGFQLALFNYVGTVESGVPVGLVNIVRNGMYLRMEVSADEVFYANVGLRAGTRHFYNIFRTGIGESWMVNFTYGFGTLVKLGESVDLGFDLTTGVVMSTQTGLKYHGLEGKLSPTLDIHLHKTVSLFFGPAANVYWFNTGSDIKPNGIAPYTFYDHTFTTGPHRIQLWAGGVVGVKIF
jgi:hypothetical protein